MIKSHVLFALILFAGIYSALGQKRYRPQEPEGLQKFFRTENRNPQFRRKDIQNEGRFIRGKPIRRQRPRNRPPPPSSPLFRKPVPSKNFPRPEFERSSIEPVQETSFEPIVPEINFEEKLPSPTFEELNRPRRQPEPALVSDLPKRNSVVLKERNDKYPPPPTSYAENDYKPPEQRDLERSVHGQADAYELQNEKSAVYQKEDRLEFQIHGHEGPDSYRYGFDTGNGYNRQFRYEEKDKNGLVKGRYGYFDPYGKLHVVNYSSHPEHGFKAEGDGVPTL